MNEYRDRVILVSDESRFKNADALDLLTVCLMYSLVQPRNTDDILGRA